MALSQLWAGGLDFSSNMARAVGQVRLGRWPTFSVRVGHEVHKTHGPLQEPATTVRIYDDVGWPSVRVHRGERCRMIGGRDLKAVS